MSVLIYTENAGGKVKKFSLEAVYYGSKIAESMGTKAIAISFGDVSNDELATLGNYGASKVLSVNASQLKDFHPQLLTEVLSQAATAENSDVFIFTHDSSGKAIAPRLSARLKAGLVSGAVALPVISGSSFSVKKNVFSGKAFAEIEILSSKKVITLLPNTLQVPAGSGVAEVSAFNPDLSASVPALTVKEVKKESNKFSLAEAEIVVSAGRGMKGPENWGMVEDLAKSIGAATACSRPVADIGWRPHHEHVGQTGVAIRPNLYFAIGISGAIQHLAGVNGSKVIVVINKDPEAPFFKAADYGIVGDAFEVLPKLISAVDKFKANHN